MLKLARVDVAFFGGGTFGTTEFFLKDRQALYPRRVALLTSPGVFHGVAVMWEKVAVFLGNGQEKGGEIGEALALDLFFCNRIR